MGAHSRTTRIGRIFGPGRKRLADLDTEAPNEAAGRTCPPCSTGRDDFPCTCPADCGRPACGGGFRP